MQPSRKSISDKHVQVLLEHVPEGSTILELGSGEGTAMLAKSFKVISVEDDPEFVGLHHSTYVQAPIVQYQNGSWYDTKVIQEIPKDYSAILVDGPSFRASLGRLGFWLFQGIFNTKVPILIDDVDEELNRIAMVLTAWSLKRSYTVHRDGMREFGLV